MDPNESSRYFIYCKSCITLMESRQTILFQLRESQAFLRYLKNRQEFHKTKNFVNGKEYVDRTIIYQQKRINESTREFEIVSEKEAKHRLNCRNFRWNEFQTGETIQGSSKALIRKPIMTPRVEEPNFYELVSDSTMISKRDLREVQKIVQHYGNKEHNVFHQIQIQMEEIKKKQEEILENVREIQKRVKDLEARPSASGRRKEGWLPPSYGTEPLLHQKGKTSEIPKEMTDNEKIRVVLKGESIPPKR